MSPYRTWRRLFKKYLVKLLKSILRTYFVDYKRKLEVPFVKLTIYVKKFPLFLDIVISMAGFSRMDFDNLTEF